MEQFFESTHEYWRSNGAFTPNVTIRLASGGIEQSTSAEDGGEAGGVGGGEFAGEEQGGGVDG